MGPPIKRDREDKKRYFIGTYRHTNTLKFQKYESSLIGIRISFMKLFQKGIKNLIV